MPLYHFPTAGLLKPLFVLQLFSLRVVVSAVHERAVRFALGTHIDIWLREVWESKQVVWNGGGACRQWKIMKNPWSVILCRWLYMLPWFICSIQTYFSSKNWVHYWPGWDNHNLISQTIVSSFQQATTVQVRNNRIHLAPLRCLFFWVRKQPLQPKCKSCFLVPWIGGIGDI